MVREQRARAEVLLQGGEAQIRRGAADQVTKGILGGLGLNGIAESLQRKVLKGGADVTEALKVKPSEPQKPAKVEERSAAKPAEPKAEDTPKEKSWWDKVKTTVGDGVKAAEEFHEDNKRQQEERGKNDQPSDTGQGFQFGSDASDVQSLLKENKLALDQGAKVADMKVAAAPTGPSGMA